MTALTKSERVERESISSELIICNVKREVDFRVFEFSLPDGTPPGVSNLQKYSRWKLQVNERQSFWALSVVCLRDSWTGMPKKSSRKSWLVSIRQADLPKCGRIRCSSWWSRYAQHFSARASHGSSFTGQTSTKWVELE